MLKRTEIVRDQSRQFDVSELFFSTTDHRGVITSFNEVFYRIADYAPGDLISKPHNIIRHPDMPRCVFKLLWDFLLAGKPIGAYVKNRAKTGEYYWVFALVTPIPEGFLSVRLKPTSEYFSLIPAIYKTLLDKEREFGDDWKSGMQASTELLLEMLKGKNFETYDDFMGKMLFAELAAREAELKRRRTAASELSVSSNRFSEIFPELSKLHALQAELRKCESFMAILAREVSLASMNAAITATRFADEGRALGVISKEVSRVSTMVAAECQIFSAEMEKLITAAQCASFNVALAMLQEEMISYFKAEQRERSMEASEEAMQYGMRLSTLNGLLETSVRRSLDEVGTTIGALKRSLDVFFEFTESLKKILVTMTFGYVTGKTLSARVTDGEKFNLILGTIMNLCDQARDEISALGSHVSLIRESSHSWTRRLDEGVARQATEVHAA